MSLPDTIEPILDALFGPGTSGPERAILLRLFRTAKDAANAAKIQAAKRQPGTGHWVARGRTFALEYHGRAGDARAAARPMQRQLHAEIRTLAERLAARFTGERPNSPSMSKLAAASEAFSRLLACDVKTLLGLLPSLWSQSIILGGVIDTDDDIRTEGRDPSLDPELRGDLLDLLRIAAPWLRGFPSIVALDRAGAAPPRNDLVAPALDVMTAASKNELVSAPDAAGIIASLAASPDDGMTKADGYRQGRRIGTLAVGDAVNLLLAACGAVAVTMAGQAARSAEEEARTERATRTLQAVREQAGLFGRIMQPDLRHAVNAVLTEVGAGPRRRAEPHVEAVDLPQDVQARAREMILLGRSPPPAWTSKLLALSFENTSLEDLSPLSGLTSLQHLNLDGTQVSDVSPLSGLTSLQSLYLDGTQVSDVSPLSGLTSLQVLDLDGTQVSDVSPLSGLTSLQHLNLDGTQVSDVSPLSGLTSLQYLYLDGTQVSDVSPLSGLTSLQTLDLRGTQVSDVSPLSGLTSLQTLYLGGTQVTDVSPVSHVPNLFSDDRPIPSRPPS